MRLTTLGTGTASPSATRVNAGHLLDAGDVRILLDCGSGVVHRLATVGADWLGITHVVLTHFHPDHILDVPTLLYAWRYGTLPPRQDPVEIIGPPGTDALLGRMSDLIADDLRAKGFPVHVREVRSGESATVGSVHLEARKVPHTEESVAYSMSRGGRRVVYTGDTGFDPSFGSWAAGCDVLLAECSLPASLAITTHMTPEQCAELAALARPRVMALTHFYPPVEQVDIRGIVQEKFDGAIVLARDGTTIEVGD
jgi:ribonuclease BN (tRNA processing enzyme)